MNLQAIEKMLEMYLDKIRNDKLSLEETLRLVDLYISTNNEDMDDITKYCSLGYYISYLSKNKN